MGSGLDGVSVLRCPICCDSLGEERRGCPPLCAVLLLSSEISLSVIPPVFSHSPLFYLHQPLFSFSLFLPCFSVSWYQEPPPPSPPPTLCMSVSLYLALPLRSVSLPPVPPISPPPPPLSLYLYLSLWAESGNETM